jgi:hypothetical protein
MRINIHRQQQMSMTFCLFGLALVLYSIVLNRASVTNIDTSNSLIRINSNQNYVSNPTNLKAIDKLEKNELSSENCPHMKPAASTLGKPLWIAGYPGSGFDLVAPLISAVTGLTSVDIYRESTCNVPVKEGAAPTGACLTHWPLVEKDSPISIATTTGTFYNKYALFVIRNPANAIPSFYTRWWRSKNQIRGIHIFPEKKEWIEWRDKRFESHLKTWKVTLQEWQRGIPAAGVLGVSLYIPFEEITNDKKGPDLTAQLANQFQDANHPATATTACLWRRVVDDEHHPPKPYPATYTAAQKKLLLQTLDDLILLMATKETQLIQILQVYREEVSSNLLLDFGEQ